jgi:hypothetical protein
VTVVVSGWGGGGFGACCAEAWEAAASSSDATMLHAASCGRPVPLIYPPNAAQRLTHQSAWFIALATLPYFSAAPNAGLPTSARKFELFASAEKADALCASADSAAGLLASAENAPGFEAIAENAAGFDCIADSIDALSLPCDCSAESAALLLNADAAWIEAARAPPLFASFEKADAFCAINPDATCRLCNPAALDVSALNELAFEASAENADGFAPSADMAFESAARAEKADAAPDIAGMFAAFAASDLNAEKLLAYLLNAAALAAIAEKAAGWLASAENPEGLLASADRADGLFDSAEKALALAPSAETVDAFNAPAALSFEPSANAD